MVKSCGSTGGQAYRRMNKAAYLTYNLKAKFKDHSVASYSSLIHKKQWSTGLTNQSVKEYATNM